MKITIGIEYFIFIAGALLILSAETFRNEREIDELLRWKDTLVIVDETTMDHQILFAEILSKHDIDIKKLKEVLND